MTLSTSAIKTGLQYFTAALFCALFGAVYELFRHSVFSYYMLYAFMIPLVGRALLFFLIEYFQWKIPGKVSRSLWQFGIATLTVGCLLQGVLEIYGTTNRLMIVYWVTGGVFLIGGAAAYFTGSRRCME